MLSDTDAYEGVWELYNQPVFQRWKWTLGNLEGILVLGGLGLLLTFTQSRAWVVLRYLVHLRNKSIRLDGDTQSDPLEHLSQVHAIKDVVPFIRRFTSQLYICLRRFFKGPLQCQVMQSQHDSPVILPLFGVAALLNALLFVVMGVAIPCIISEGILGSPLVKSRINDACLEESNLYRAEGPHDTDAIFQLCKDYGHENPGCGEQLYLQQPKITKSRSQVCPFPGNICYSNNTDLVELIHENITGFDIGINTKSKILMNHRLTCSPIHLDSFLLTDLGPHHLTNISVKNLHFAADDYVNSLYITHSLLPYFNLTLKSFNGPNRFSNEYSGNPVGWNVSPPRDLTVLPNIETDSVSEHERPIYNSMIHPNLRRDDGIPFLVIYRGRGFNFVTPVDDPLFAAHTKCYGDTTKYCPDHEATALACLDQAKYYISGSKTCTSWGAGYEEAIAMKKKFENEDIESLADLWAFSIARNSLSLHNYLKMRQKSSPVPINTVGSPFWNEWWRPKVAKDQWVAEVETWFMRAITQAILEVQTGLRYNSIFKWFDPISSGLDAQFSTCHRIIFRNANHTVINWLGFWLISCLLVLICLASYTVKSLDKAIRTSIKGVARFIKHFWKRLISAGKTLEILILDWGRRTISRYLGRLYQRRTWYASKVHAPRPRTESTRHGSREFVHGSDFDDSHLASVSVSLDQLGAS